MQNYLLLILLITITFLKAAADGYNYKFNTTVNDHDKKFFGVVYHLFGVLLIGVPLLFIYFEKIHFTDFGVIIAAFALIYFGIFDAIYNRITNRPLLYIGKTDVIDMFLSRVFAKPFLRWVLFCIRWLCLGVGMYLIIDVLKF